MKADCTLMIKVCLLLASTLVRSICDCYLAYNSRKPPTDPYVCPESQPRQSSDFSIPGDSPEINLNPSFTLPKARGFKIAAINITILPKYIDQLRTYMLNQPADILAINESRLDSSISSKEIGIPAYVIERNDRNRYGGGVALYIRNNIDYDRDETLTLSSLELKWLCVKVKNPRSKPFLVATRYRPPLSGINLMDTFESLLEKLESQGIEINILGVPY